jgi:hypothetical protein
MPAAKKTLPNEALYDKLIATIPEIERKGDANPYTSLNGNMFTLLHQSGWRSACPKTSARNSSKSTRRTCLKPTAQS